ncbi:FtsK/SpoIIIE domain-containing protein [Leuconostoc lactis]|uniref:FtsK/SpoIIIE domain-containing protein n=1 Tax=Leuconostoc lactis TaxID=1246 RepID=UPI0031CEF962
MVKKNIKLPKVSLKNNGKVGFTIYFPLDGQRYQDQFRDRRVSQPLSAMLYADAVGSHDIFGYKTFDFVSNPLGLRIGLQDMEITDHSIEIMKGLVWDFSKYPHGLITGDTGSGKSFFLFSLISGLIKSGAIVDIADPKETDLSILGKTASLKYRVSYGRDRILKAFYSFYLEMLKRGREYHDLLNDNLDENVGSYRKYGLKPHFFVFDEFAAFVSTLKYADAEAVKQILGQIVMLGRQLGFFIITAMQRPDAEFIGSAARDQIQFRVALGKMKDSGLRMMFPDDVDEVQFKELDRKLKGWGYLALSPTQARSFFAPVIPGDFVAFNYFDQLGEKFPAEPVTPLGELKTFVEERKLTYVAMKV